MTSTGGLLHAVLGPAVSALAVVALGAAGPPGPEASGIPASVQGTWYVWQTVAPMTRAETGLLSTPLDGLVGQRVTVRKDRVTRPYFERTGYGPTVTRVSAGFATLLDPPTPGAAFAVPAHDDPVTAYKVSFASCDNRRADPAWICAPVTFIPTALPDWMEMTLPAGYAVLGRRKPPSGARR